MDDGSARSFLYALWADLDVQNLRCYHCGSRIDMRSVLARTFYLKSHCIPRAEPHDYAKVIDVPELGDKMIIFDRHLHCLLESTEYVVISHVWHKGVAEAQNRKECIDDIARTVRDIPARVCQGVRLGLGKIYEIWHDYISVPQWHSGAKAAIIPAIPTLFERAMLTIVYASDLEAATIGLMRDGGSVEIRCRAISNICNIKWFSRVWTAMELTQSRRIRFMTKDFDLLREAVHDGLNRENIVVEIGRRWYAEEAKAGSAIAIEEMVGMGYNLVPWQLGPLDQIRVNNESGNRSAFATAHELFARRGVTNPRDFFHVLLGTLKSSLTEPMLSKDTHEALLQVARSCVNNADLSPFFMVPARFQGPLATKRIQSYGFNDLDTFGLGTEQRGPKHVHVKSNPANGNHIVTAEHIGQVQRIRYEDLLMTPKDSFAKLVRCTMEVAGDDMENFIQTLGVRLYGQDAERIYRRLSEEGRRGQLKTMLSTLRSIWFGLDWTFSLSYDETPIIFAQSRHADSSIRCRIDLAKRLGNDDGRFLAASAGFHLSARAVQLTGMSISAELRTRDGQWKYDEIDVRRLINFEETEERLEWIADAMGLSNQALHSEMTTFPPLEFLMSHGGTMHMGSHCGLLSVNCSSCHESFLLRAAVFSKDHEVAGLTAWRFPGLKYEYTHEGGTGVVLKDYQIVGRILWAAETCGCPKLQDVEISLHNIPVPQPNTFDYGKSKSPGWIPVGRAF